MSAAEIACEEGKRGKKELGTSLDPFNLKPITYNISKELNQDP
jgi:hypothetical protein